MAGKSTATAGGELHRYEKTQRFNALTRFLHSVRYRNLTDIAQGMTPRGDRLRVLDIGCGVCEGYRVLREVRPVEYRGIELERSKVETALERYRDEGNFSVVEDDIRNHFEDFDGYDLVIGLESFEHIPEPIVSRTLEALGRSDLQRLYITVPNEVGPAIAIKNVGSFLMGYKRYQEYSWAETFHASIYNLDRVEPHGTRHKGFDWRWLAHTIRQNLRIVRTYTSPVQAVPSFVSPSIGFEAVPRKS